jgi:hypothetical protein
MKVFNSKLAAIGLAAYRYSQLKNGRKSTFLYS